jgi:hypothetical protein
MHARCTAGTLEVLRDTPARSQKDERMPALIEVKVPLRNYGETRW